MNDVLVSLDRDDGVVDCRRSDGDESGKKSFEDLVDGLDLFERLVSVA